MKLNILLVLTILTLLTSCNGQTSGNNRATEHITKGDTVNELGTSIMIIYQDKSDVYWYGSWETGVYRYDGKALIIQQNTVC